MDRILAIDTSGPILGLSVFSSVGCIARVDDQLGTRHAENLLPRIKALVDEAGLGGTIDAVAVAKGPGSFTGLRIGSATAKALAYAWGVPLLSVDTLHAYAVTERYERIAAAKPPVEVIVPVIDARKQRFYAAVFRPENGGTAVHRASEDHDLTEEAIAGTIPSYSTIAFPGSEARRFDAAYGGDTTATAVSAAVGVAIIAREAMNAGARDNDYDGPYYLREGDIGSRKTGPHFKPEG